MHVGMDFGLQQQRPPPYGMITAAAPVRHHHAWPAAPAIRASERACSLIFGNIFLLFIFRDHMLLLHLRYEFRQCCVAVESAVSRAHDQLVRKLKLVYTRFIWDYERSKMVGFVVYENLSSIMRWK